MVRFNEIIAAAKRGARYVDGHTGKVLGKAKLPPSKARGLRAHRLRALVGAPLDVRAAMTPEQKALARRAAKYPKKHFTQEQNDRLLRELSDIPGWSPTDPPYRLEVRN